MTQHHVGSHPSQAPGHRMYLAGLGTATPEQRYTKADCWEAFKVSAWFERLDRRARTITELVLLRDNGIDPVNAFWFAQHVAAQMAYGRLCGPSVFPYRGDIEAVTAEAVRFALLGIGLNGAAIDANYDPTRQSALCQAGQSDQAPGMGAAATGTSTAGAGPLSSADWPVRQPG